MKIQITQVLLTATLIMAAPILKAGPISLAPIGNASSPEIVKRGEALNVTGSCGGAIVKVLGISQGSFSPDKDVFSFDGSNEAGVVVQANGGKPALKVSGSDYNTVLCLPVGPTVGAQFRLIMGTACAGSRCTDAMDYTVVDPHLGKTVSPKKCDIGCASKLIKSNVLKEVGLM